MNEWSILKKNPKLGNQKRVKFDLSTSSWGNF